MKTNCFTLALTLALTLAFAATSSAQSNSWTNRYNGTANNRDEATAIAVDKNGNVFVTGFSSGSLSSWDYVTIKYSNAGVPLWTNRYDGPGSGLDQANAVAVDNNGNVFVTGGAFGGNNNRHYATIKYSSAGVPLWTNLYVYGSGNGFDEALAIAVDGNGRVFVTGQSHGSGTNYSDYATIAYSTNGIPLWTNRYNGPGNTSDYAYAITVDGNGNVFVTGYSSGSGSSTDYATLKYSNNGVPLWTNRYNGPGNEIDMSRAIAVDGGGNVFVTGHSGGNGSGWDYATIKYSNNGMPLWTNRYNGLGNNNDQALAIVLDANDDVFVVGSSSGGDSGWDNAMIKYSNNGIPLWTNYNGPGRAIAVDDDGNVFVTGSSTDSNFFSDYTTFKYSNNGVPLWTNRYSNLGNSTNRANAIAVDGNGNVFVTGYSYGSGSGSDYDYATIKYAAPSRIAVLENSQVAGSEFSFHLVAEPGGQFAIQVSTNLVNWEAMHQVAIPAGGSTNIVDSMSSAGRKYYRALRQ